MLDNIEDADMKAFFLDRYRVVINQKKDSILKLYNEVVEFKDEQEEQDLQLIYFQQVHARSKFIMNSAR